MAIKTYKPTTPSRRHMTVSAFEGIDKKAKPERSLTENLKKNAGRNSYGRITVRHRGGGNKRSTASSTSSATRWNARYRHQPAVRSQPLRQHRPDPVRGRREALYPGSRDLKAGHKIMTVPTADILPGNCLPIANIPVGEMIHCIELYPG